MEKTERLQWIGDQLSAMIVKTRFRSMLRTYDHHILMEDVVCKLLNMVYGWELVNLNYQKKNHPGIDLGDDKNRIAVQVTSDKSRNKVVDTLRKFEEHRCFKEYDRLIIFIVGEQECFKKEFTTQAFTFSPEMDILDLTVLFKAIQAADESVQDAVYDYLLNRSSAMPQWVRRMATAFLCVMIIGLLVFVGVYADKVHRESNPKHEYEQCMDWLSMDEAAAVFGGESRVEVYKDYSGANAYYDGAALTVLYNNLDDQDRAIRRLTVYAEDIVRDYSPKLLEIWHESLSPLVFHIYNEGWGETGNISINFIAAYPTEGNASKTPAVVSLQDGADKVWTFDSLQPGESRVFPLLSEKDLKVELLDEFEGSILFMLLFELEAPETGYKMALNFPVEVLPDGTVLPLEDGRGDGDDIHYVVMVDTTEPQWSRSFVIDQILPAKRTVRLPIFIVPDQSCSMTVRIEFETADGEIIQATPLENANFIVPYYTDPYYYIDGSLIDWEKLDGSEVIYFPFTTVPYVIREESDP